MVPCGLDSSEVGGGVSRVLLGPSGMDNCDPLAIVVQETRQGAVCLSRWQPSAIERARIAAGADVLLYVWGGQVPVALGVIDDAGFGVDERLS